jgi:hypothetical protein
MRKVFLMASAATVNTALETWYIQNRLLGGVSYTLDIELPQISNSVLIYLELGEISADLIGRARAQGNLIILFHMGDELGRKDISLYSQCDIVIRNYYFPHIFEQPALRQKLFWVPNGFRTGVGPRDAKSLKPATERAFLASFMGWLNNPNSHNNERALFAQIIPHCGQNLFVHTSAGFAGGYNLGLYATMTESSVFSPCPAGNCPDSIRLYDALELGSIPIYLDHEFLRTPYALGGVPFPILRSWDELPAFLETQRQILQRDPQQILPLQKSCIEWWSIYNRKLAARIDEVIFGLATRSL